MNIWQAFTMALKSIAMKKTRSFLTMLGIIIGVASVVIMVSVVQGQNKKNMEYFEKMGNNKITVSAYSYYDSNNETSQKLYDYCLSLSDLVDGITPDIELGDKATEIYNELSGQFMCDYDETGSIGKRYRREDEIGTPFCITVDFQTVGDENTPADNCVTVRERDSMEQVRMPIDQVAAYIAERIKF